MEADFEKRIRDDLAKAGMLSELRVRRVFDDAGWPTRGPGAYFDKEEEKSREGDLYATRVSSVNDDGITCIHCELTAVIEVKKSERPWVVFKRPLRGPSVGCAWNNLIAKVNLPCETSRLAPYLAEHSLLNVLGWEGAGIHESFKSPDQPSRWYSAFVSSLKWASQMRDELPDEGGTQNDIRENPTELYFFQPVIVLDGRLISAELNKRSEIEVSEIDMAAFKFSYASKAYEKSYFRVDLVTVDGLPKYVELLSKRQDSIVDGIINQAGPRTTQWKRS